MAESRYRIRAEDADLIEVLNAISVVSNRLAHNLTVLARQHQSEEGGKTYERNERNGYYRREAAHLRCHP